ncbi:MAG: AgmX/PglI C-terminal domain-containing protein [Bdellovibrionales bacterium]
MKQPIVLRVYKGDKLETVRQFESNQIVIGRNADVQLELQDDEVSLLHAMIEKRDGDYYLSDLGSPSGTFRNGQKVLEDKLSSGDTVSVGPFRIQFFVGIPKPAAPPKVSSPSAEKPPAKVSFTTAVPEPPVDHFDDRTDPMIEAPKPAKKEAPPKPAPKKGKAAAAAAAMGAAKDSHKTFAPPSPYKDLKEIIKPHKGSVVEVIVAWGDRILSSTHFSKHGSVFMSSAEDADVFVPIISSRSKFELLKIGAQVSVCLTQEMSGELVRDGESLTLNDLAKQNKIRDAGSHFEYDLRQGEMLRIGLQNDLLSVYVRFVAETPKPLVAPLLDMSSSEVTGVILAIAISAILGLYMNIYTPSSLLDDEAKLEEPIRKATIKFEKKKIIQVDMEKKQEKPVEDKKPQQVRKSQQAVVESKGDPGQAGGVKKDDKLKEKPKKMVSSREQGKAVKTAPKEGANMKSQKPDPTKMGLLGVFANKGTQKQINKAYSGSGDLVGMADEATGYAGNAENRNGDNFGGKLKETGSGRGSGTVGIAGVGTKGRGTGGTGYGTGGIGTKGSVQINVGGQDADFSGGMDREAIRRVIREHLREIRTCYERELQRTPDLYGKVVIQWDIEEGGRVSSAGVKRNELGNDTVGDCIVSRLRTWKFPDPPKDQVGRVSFPFVFSSQ